MPKERAWGRRLWTERAGGTLLCRAFCGSPVPSWFCPSLSEVPLSFLPPLLAGSLQVSRAMPLGLCGTGLWGLEANLAVLLAGSVMVAGFPTWKMGKMASIHGVVTVMDGVQQAC